MSAKYQPADFEKLRDLLIEVLIEDERNVDVASGVSCDLIDKIRRAVHTHDPDKMMFFRGCIACEREKLASQ